MGFFNTIKEVITNKPSTLREPTFIKRFNDDNKQLINKMKSLHEVNKDGYWVTEETMYKIANSLMKHNGTYKIDYEKKYGISNITNEATTPLKDKSEKVTSNIEESPLYKELKEYRLNRSREEKVKPYFLYNNQELEVIIKVKPKTIEELKSIKGFGDVKCEKYGRDIINIINKY